MRRAVVALAAFALTACGALESPDLETGSLTGHLAHASAAAYVYPLGRPDLRVAVGADGRYTLGEVPVETGSLVVADELAGAWLAALVPVSVAGGDVRAVQDLDAVALPPAGRVAAVARLGGGCTSTEPRFTVEGTDQVDVAAASAGAAALLDVLPAGPFELHARSGGFTEGSAAITVVSGATVFHEIELEVEHGDETPGCLAPGTGCRAGLLCGPDDGVCHECLEDGDCGGEESACVERSCRLPATAGELCDPCTQDAGCQSGTCAEEGGFCTRTCAADGDCPAGMACEPDGVRSVCRAPSGCAELEEELGAECFTDAGCAEDLAGGVCLGDDTAVEPPLPGYCTAPCASAADCAVAPGFVCGGSGYCEPVP